ncbi:MAG: prolyl oligopeptidase family serine peptidase [Elusimicrobiota bacterium]|nr:prolyl oligopeptidase family serine peptidase [Elusimicrobiota bacterium]
MRTSASARLVAVLLTLCAPAAADDRLWLEEVEAPKALEWVKARNAESLGELESDPRYKAVEGELRTVLLAEDRIPAPDLKGRWVYNFWQDAKSVRGLWRRATVAEYRKPAPRWETVLDLDAFAAAEKENWVWKGATCLPPAYERCLLKLSRGGKDASVIREFDAKAKAFVKDGFTLPEAKSYAHWQSADALLVATDFGPGSLTKAGYPRVVKRWKRGTPLGAAKTVFEAGLDDNSVSAWTEFTPEGRMSFVARYKTFWESDKWVLMPDGGLEPIALPPSADLRGWKDGRLFFSLREALAMDGASFPAGALIALPIGTKAAPELVWAPDERSSLGGVAFTRKAVYLELLRDVQGSIALARRDGSRWSVQTLAFPAGASLEIAAYDPFGERVLVNAEGFTLPTTMLALDGPGAAPAAWKSIPARFDATGLAVEQRWAVSRDKTRVPYFLVRKADAPLDGSAPTLLYGYGGFEHSLTPWYPAAAGKAWLERGGAYAVANIRGGGEFGPRWHRAALKENRQLAFDDFLAVAEDLIASKVTSSRRLGIMGGSNGGLLVGAALTQRPDLFNAVVVQVPLLDMMRYHKLLAGHLWVGEYGSPDDPVMGPVIRKYSPYQNARPKPKYPKTLVITSTKDDRVHPGHARRFVARLKELRQPVLYFENMEGGHSAAANLEQRVRRQALEFTYLLRQLKD